MLDIVFDNYCDFEDYVTDKYEQLSAIVKNEERFNLMNEQIKNVFLSNKEFANRFFKEYKNFEKY